MSIFSKGLDAVYFHSYVSMIFVIGIEDISIWSMIVTKPLVK